MFRRLCLVLLALLVLAFGMTSSAAVLHVQPLEIQCGVAQYGNGTFVRFGASFSTTPVVITSAQFSSKAVSSCAVSNSRDGFTLYLTDDNKRPVSQAYVQWIAFMPKQSLNVLGGVQQANDGQRLSFASLPATPVIVTNAQANGIALNSAAVSNARDGCYLSLRDQDDRPVQGAWVQWIAVVPGDQNGLKGNVAQRSNGANVSFSPGFNTGPVYVMAAQLANEACAAAAVDNRNDGFRLALTRHDGSAANGFWTQWLGYAAPLVATNPIHYALIVGGENQGNPYYDWYWGAASGMYDVLKNRYGYQDANIFFLFCDTHNNDPRVDGMAAKANVQSALSTIAGRMKSVDKLFCYFVGHGTYANGCSTYNTVGVDLTDAELNTWRQGIPSSDQTYIFTQCNSGHFCAALARPGTVILTSTTKDETNVKAFAEPIRDAFKMASGADANGDGKISVGEAYNYALRNVQQQFGSLPVTEHCQCEDNHDGASSYGILPTAGHGQVALNRYLQ